ncbi:MAG: type III-A CRISPR-associated protein Csm2 [Anaerolineae bacterium]|nr:type III-A CRISPR-associated protein Csm2 [Anaerolineae bacterium]
MPDLTPQNVIQELEHRTGSLSQALSIEDFAEPDKLADRLARSYKDRLKATQLRRFFHAIKSIERGMRGYKDEQSLPIEIRSKLLPLMPELAYARGRNLIPEDFYGLMKACLASKKLQTVGDFRRLTLFLTAVLAYHKLYA